MAFSPMKDKQGNEYATITDLNIGDKVRVDGDFTCLEPNSIHVVKYDEEQGYHYIDCSHGHHGLGSQLAEDGISLIGIYPA